MRLFKKKTPDAVVLRIGVLPSIWCRAWPLVALLLPMVVSMVAIFLLSLSRPDGIQNHGLRLPVQLVIFAGIGWMAWTLLRTGKRYTFVANDDAPPMAKYVAKYAAQTRTPIRCLTFTVCENFGGGYAHWMLPEKWLTDLSEDEQQFGAAYVVVTYRRIAYVVVAFLASMCCFGLLKEVGEKIHGYGSLESYALGAIGSVVGMSFLLAVYFVCLRTADNAALKLFPSVEAAKRFAEKVLDKQTSRIGAEKPSVRVERAWSKMQGKR